MFYSLQGEGKYVGEPAIFIRLAGCNLNCQYCDTKYAFRNGKKMSVQEVSDRISKMIIDIGNLHLPMIVFTGGEPTLQIEEIYELLDKFSDSIKVHLETNGTYVDPKLAKFDYVAFSPKLIEDAKKVQDFVQSENWSENKYDIKVVTNGWEMKTDMLTYATMLMPLTLFNKKMDKKIKLRTWKLCMKYSKKYSPRIHIDIHGKKRGV
jgi:organic radical activating enzyme